MSNSRDLLSNPLTAIIFFCLPAAAMIVTGFERLGGAWRTAVWTIALAIMGAACLVNTRRCGRMHCYFTGPFFLIMALLSLLYGVGWIPLGRSGWNAIALAVVIGAFALCCLPEMVFGRYRHNRAAGADRR